MPTTAGSPFPSSSSATAAATATATATVAAGDPSNPIPNLSSGGDSMQSWWESISLARSQIHSLAAILSAPSLAALADSDRPARSLLDSPEAYSALADALSQPAAGAGDDPLCQWLYETFQAPDPDLRLVVLAALPLLAGLYLSRVVSGGAGFGNASSLAGFEAVLLSLYASEAKARGGKPLLVAVPDLSLPSLYHSPRPNPSSGVGGSHRSSASKTSPSPPPPAVGVLSPPLEPQIAVKSTKRACIVGVALDIYYKKIALLPSPSKCDLCEFVAAWAGQHCPCRFELDDEPISSSSSSSHSTSSSPQARNFSEDDGGIGNAVEEMGKLGIVDRLNGHHCNGEEVDLDGARVSRRGARVPLPWELLQPVLRILGHCLLGPLNPQEVRDAAAMAVRCVYARASHDLMPQAILAARSLIQLDKSARKVASAAVIAAPAGSASNPNAPSKPKKPELFLV